MNNNRLRLPVGIENFHEIVTDNYYYIDKTKLIEQLLNNGDKVSLFTRPRRFGKTLNMSMLKYFFEIGNDSNLFNGLYISNNEDLCSEHLGKYPVIFITLKDVDGLTFNDALSRLIMTIGREADRFDFLLEGNGLNKKEKDRFRAIVAEENGDYTMNRNVLVSSLKTLCELLSKYYSQKVVILIDEYDVPLDKAFNNGYYNEMVSLIKDLLGSVLKTNDDLAFAVLTGCLRVSKESIFTGLNNFNVLSITDSQFDEMFGFTQSEVEGILKAYNLSSHLEEIKKWYDGYRFGNAEIYCPWDVLSHIQRLCADENAKPQPYWINSSGNSLIRRFIDKADKLTRDEIELLLNGESIEKEVKLELTYGEIDDSIDNLWSVLFTTGYLTKVGDANNGIYKLKIPNKEISEVYKTQISDWFKETIRSDRNMLDPFWMALLNGDSNKIENILNDILNRTISVFDPKGEEKEKEKYYHALLTGILIGNGTWSIYSNKESGDGFPDIIAEPVDPDSGLVFEIKVADKFTDLDAACDRAMIQICDKRYKQYLIDEGRFNIWAYAIAFYKKRCKAVVKKL